MQVLKIQDVVRKTTLSRSMIYKLQSEGEFPKSFQFTANAVRWLECEVDEYIAQKAASRNLHH